jgi:hypothetical protein
MYTIFDPKIKFYIKRLSIAFIVLVLAYFAYVTDARFSGNEGYASVISENSIIQDPALYSIFDYLSQWYQNSSYLLDNYTGETFKGQISLQSILIPLNTLGVINFSLDELTAIRKTLWPTHWYTFNGLVAYSVYDYGYFLTFILSLIYFIVILKFSPINNSISLIQLLIMALLVQIPLLSIFYSAISGLMLPMLYLIPICLYLK